MALRLIDVSHSFGSQQALEHVSLHLREGDCYGFLGHNGAGKTTALRIALGLLRPRSGTVLVEGFDAARHPCEARARIGGLVETPGFHPALGGAANLWLLGRLQGLGPRAAREEAARTLAAVGLDAAGRKPVGAYSQGMRQRLGIAQALLGRPRIVLLDEPTNGLDPEGIEEMRRLLRRLTRDDGVSVLLSSHQLHELEGLCNRVGVLREGRLLLEAETRELLDASRHELAAGDPRRARDVLGELGVAVQGGDERLVLDLAGHEPDSVLAALVSAGAGPRSFSARGRSLEDVYLSLDETQVRASATSASGPPGPPGAPPTREAPPRPVLRVAGYDARRSLAGWGVPLLLALPAAVASLSVVGRYVEAQRDAAEIAAGTLGSATSVTAFEGVATALRSGLPVLALVTAAIASQSVAGESTRGTLRNVLLRPLTRFHAALGKLLAIALAGFVGYALLVAAAFATASAAFDFGDLSEVLLNGELFPLVPAEELWAPLRRALFAPLPGVAACAVFGFAAGTLVRGAAGALGATIGGLFLIDFSRLLLDGLGAGVWVPSAHFPTPLRDTSFVRHFLDLTQGISNASAFAEHGVLAPAVWILLGFGLAAFALSRRSVR